MSTTIDRSMGLGASDASAACGLSKWKTPYQLWREKVLGDQPDISEKLAIEVGKALEPVIIDRFARSTGLAVTDQQRIVVDSSNPWRWVTLDGVASDGALIEAKSVGFANPEDWGEEDTDMIPMSYYCQTQHALSCVGAETCYVPVIVLNRTERLYKIQRDNDFIADMIEREKQFMEMVWNKTPPDPISIADLNLRYPADNGMSIIADISTAAAIDDFTHVKAELKALEKREEALKLAIGAFMGDASELVDSMGRTLCTYKSQSRSGLDTKGLKKDHPTIAQAYATSSQFRVMRLK